MIEFMGGPMDGAATDETDTPEPIVNTKGGYYRLRSVRVSTCPCPGRKCMKPGHYKVIREYHWTAAT